MLWTILKFHIIIIKFTIFVSWHVPAHVLCYIDPQWQNITDIFTIFINKNSQIDTFFPKLKNTIVKIDIKSFSVWNISYFSIWCGKTNNFVYKKCIFHCLLNFQNCKCIRIECKIISLACLVINISFGKAIYNRQMKR